MARVHPILFTLASGAMLYSGLAPALGLGDISLRSALNQPLDAEIQLLEPGDLDSYEVIVRLASPEVYQRAGVERFAFLNDLRFAPILNGRGSVIRVVSNRPVREPYLNFIVEVVRPGGSLLREYTLLLDPPESAAYQAVAAQQPMTPRASQAADSMASPPPRVAPPAAELGKQYQVQRGDSLWSIARRVHAPGGPLSLSQLMQGIHALNPNAFVGGDSHRLIAGATLRLPDASALPEQAAPAAAVAQASEEPTTPAVPAAEETLSLQQLNDAQLRLEAELNAQASEKLQLQQGIADLQLKLDSLEQQLRGKDQQIADLQERLAQTEPGVSPAVASAAKTPASDSAAAPASAPEESDSRGWFNFAWQGGLLALLLGALLFLLVRRNRRERPQEAAAAAAPEPVAKEAPAAVAAEAQPVRSMTTPGDDLDGAELYLAYGRHGAALSILRKLAHRQPQRSDVQLRLLDVLGLVGDAGGFTRQLAVLAGLGVAAELVEPIKARYPELADNEPAEEVVAEPEEGLGVELGELDDESAVPVDDDFQLNLDDLTLDADWDLVSPFKAGGKPARAPESAPEVLDADFRSNLDVLPEVQELADDGTAFGGFDEPLVVDSAPLDETLDEEFLDVFDDPELEQSLRASDDLAHLAGERANVIKLNLAMAYIEQGNVHSACGILNEVISDGSPEEQREARALLARIA
ncbi:FimV/HubP family polar landmark protein [Zestomonas carbonaria]|uniref:LysM domain-containing protein n=1 Tax=Zestomonas carbonaria TaxID=2762745 RepID=A0A7U7ERB7_9GAMM|nr:FimV/HubP family polar landmark protein [Pseudomonas carbonaria]CAD5109665.1 hypothetical protein PSEWESI4_03971 [Pseudomonas carbonaria]